MTQQEYNIISENIELNKEKIMASFDKLIEEIKSFVEQKND